jgi:hypothetical protein
MHPHRATVHSLPESHDTFDLRLSTPINPSEDGRSIIIIWIRIEHEIDIQEQTCQFRVRFQHSSDHELEYKTWTGGCWTQQTCTYTGGSGSADGAIIDPWARGSAAWILTRSDSIV